LNILIHPTNATRPVAAQLSLHHHRLMVSHHLTNSSTPHQASPPAVWRPPGSRDPMLETEQLAAAADTAAAPTAQLQRRPRLWRTAVRMHPLSILDASIVTPPPFVGRVALAPRMLICSQRPLSSADCVAAIARRRLCRPTWGRRARRRACGHPSFSRTRRGAQRWSSSPEPRCRACGC